MINLVITKAKHESENARGVVPGRGGLLTSTPTTDMNKPRLGVLLHTIPQQFDTLPEAKMTPLSSWYKKISYISYIFRNSINSAIRCHRKFAPSPSPEGAIFLDFALLKATLAFVGISFPEGDITARRISWNTGICYSVQMFLFESKANFSQIQNTWGVINNWRIIDMEKSMAGLLSHKLSNQASAWQQRPWCRQTVNQEYTCSGFAWSCYSSAIYMCAPPTSHTPKQGVCYSFFVTRAGYRVPDWWRAVVSIKQSQER